jgi:uncharacterized protein (TIGR00255 family)
MAKSMTGYGRAESLSEGGKILLEIKSLNHRYLETSLRLSGVFSPFELEIKKKISARFSRGKIEVSIRADANFALGNGSGLGLNLPLLRDYHALLCRMKEELNLKDDVTLAMMTSFKDIFVSMEEVDPNHVWEKVEALLDEAIAALMLMREKEGAVLCRDLIERMSIAQQLLDSIEVRLPQLIAAYQKRLTERVRELMGDAAVDESRLMQEVAIMAEKSDISEEIVRFRSHIGQFIDLLQSDDVVGRKVDFLIQEMGREVNTIGSKSSDVEISRAVIGIKSELARIREQVQNLE